MKRLGNIAALVSASMLAFAPISASANTVGSALGASASKAVSARAVSRSDKDQQAAPSGLLLVLMAVAGIGLGVYVITELTDSDEPNSP